MAASNDIKIDYDCFSFLYKELNAQKHVVELLGLFYLAETPPVLIKKETGILYFEDSRPVGGRRKSMKAGQDGKRKENRLSVNREDLRSR